MKRTQKPIKITDTLQRRCGPKYIISPRIRKVATEKDIIRAVLMHRDLSSEPCSFPVGRGNYIHMVTTTDFAKTLIIRTDEMKKYKKGLKLREISEGSHVRTAVVPIRLGLLA